MAISEIAKQAGMGATKVPASVADVEIAKKGAKLAALEQTSEAITQKLSAVNDSRVQAVSSVQKVSAQEVKGAMETANKNMQALYSKLTFNVDKETGYTVIKVTDSESGEVIRQLPSADFLHLAQHMVRIEQMLRGSDPRAPAVDAAGLLFETKI